MLVIGFFPMPFSMTGMGKAHRRSPGFFIQVELKSVNNRYLAIKCRLPEELQGREQRLQEIVRRHIVRGTVDLTVKIQQDVSGPVSRINKDRLNSLIEVVKRIRRKEGIEEPVVPELLLGLPGVMEPVEKAGMTGRTLKLVEETLAAALQPLIKMRAAEGGRLIRAIMKRRRLLGSIIRTVERKTRSQSKERARKLKARVEELLDRQVLSPTDPALQREIAVLSDRADISEELDRFSSHLVQFDAVVRSNGEIGRQLDFLLQEMGREVNTIGSKASCAEVSHDVVRMKAEMEKIREQVQNIE